MGSFAQDLKYGIRNLARHPGFAAAAMATLALGIAANTTVFSMVDAILLESLPYTDPGRLVSVYETDGRGNASPLSAPNFVDWTSSNHVFDGTAAVAFGGGGTITGTDQPERVLGVFVSPEFFPLLGVAPALGHGFADKDDANAVILSYSVWQRRFAGDPDIVGKKVTLSDAGCTVAGVLPREFYFLNRRIELWRPLHFTPDQFRHRDQRFLTVIARLKPGVTSGQAQRELLLLAQRSDKTRSARVVSLRDDLVQGIRRTLLLLFGAVAFVLLIAVANIANLLLARAASREKEFAIRAALGAGRARIIRQLLTESMLVAGCGCVMGILLAAWGVRFLVAVVPNEYRVAIVGADRIGIHGAVLAFSAGLSVLTALLFGLAPALILAARDPQSSLKIGRSESHGRGGRRLHSVLVVSEVALTLVLLIGAALLIQSFSRLQGVNPGYSRDNILTMRVFLADSRYPKPAQQVAFFEKVLQRIEGLPGVQTASVVNYLPVESNLRHFTIEGRPAPGPGDEPEANEYITAPHYFRTLGIPVLRGRDFTGADREGTPGVAIISAAALRRYWSGEDPIGKRLKVESSAPVEIIGVVGDNRQDPERDPAPAIYRPFSQAPAGFVLVIRCATRPLDLTRAVLQQLWKVDKDEPVMWIGTMREFADEVVWQRRLAMLLLTVFASLALLLASVGVYGVMSYHVGRRTREIGIRMALGAKAGDITRMVLGHALKLAAVGAAFGLAAAVALTQLLASQLYGVAALDAPTFITVAIFLTSVVLAASYLPARKAMRLDPNEALRSE